MTFTQNKNKTYLFIHMLQFTYQCVQNGDTVQPV